MESNLQYKKKKGIDQKGHLEKKKKMCTQDLQSN